MLVDLPCYSAPEVQDDFRNKIWKSCRMKKSSIRNTEIVKILAPLTYNPNAPNNGKTPSSVTNNAEIRSFLESFDTSRKRKSGQSIKPSKKRAKKF